MADTNNSSNEPIVYEIKSTPQTIQTPPPPKTNNDK